MKLLIVYYSLEGSTRTIAEEMARVSGGDLLEIHPVKEFPSQSGWKYVVGGFYSTMRRPCPIQDYDVDLEKYDLIVIGTPVWAYNPSPPIVTFMKDPDLKGKKIALFCTHGGGPKSAMDVMKSYFNPEQIVSTIDYIGSADNKESNILRAQKWIKVIMKLI